MPALCQEDGTHKSEVSIGGFLPFVNSTSAYGVQQSTSRNGGILAGYRFFFGKHSGVEVSYGYSRSTQTYSPSGGPRSVGNSSDEVFRSVRTSFSA